MKTSLLKSKKIKMSFSGAALTVAFIAVIVVFNMIFTTLAQKYMWFIDMTERKIFTLSPEAKETISDITDEVYIYFASEPDVLMANSMCRYIYTTALQLDEAFPNIHTQCVDILKNPSFFKEYYETAATSIDPTSVVIVSGGEVSVMKYSLFFVYDDTSDQSTVWAYNGEKKFISAIMQVTRTETPKVIFTTEHGEDIASAAALANVFRENGFEIDTVDLSKESVDDDCRILVIYDPIYDFVGAEAEDSMYNEIDKIDEFLDDYGCLLVFCDPQHVGSLTNLNEFLAEWGISYVGGATVKDTEHSMSVDGYSIIAQYKQDGAGGLYLADLNNLATPPKTIFRKAAPINILWSEGGGLNARRTVSAMLKSYPTSEIMINGESAGKGEYNLLTVSREQRIVDNDTYYSYVIAAGSPSFASQSYLVSNSYANEDIISASMQVMGKDRVLASFTYKPFDDTKLTITTAESNRWTVYMTLTLPLIIAVIGIVVVTKRKHL